MKPGASRTQEIIIVIQMVLLAVIVASAALQGAAWPVCVAYLQRVSVR